MRPTPSHLLFLASALLSALLFSLPWQWINRLESDSLDFRFHLRGAEKTHPQVVVIGIADSSFTLAERAPSAVAENEALAAMGQPWPWDRRIFAALVERLQGTGARAIVFDIVFKSQTAGDSEFAKALQGSEVPVVLAKLYTPEQSGEGEHTLSVVEPVPAFEAAVEGQVGFANIWPDDDGLVREAPGCLSESELLGFEAGAEERREASLSAAVAGVLATGNKQAEGLINFRGPARSMPIIPIENLFLSDRWHGAIIDEGRLFSGKVVVVGPLSEVRFKDFHTTPYGRMSGVELQANLIETYFGDRFLRRASLWWVVLLVGGFSFLGAAVCWRLARARQQLLVLSSFVLLWLTISQLAFVYAYWVLPVFAPVAALLSTGAVGLGLRYAGEQRERRRFRALLSSYVSEEVAEIIVRQPENLKAAFRGERRPVTILFADLRGFSSLSEKLPPEQLVTQLNEYLFEMVQCIMAEGGTVQKYIGDAILAAWGDTHSSSEEKDAEQAVAAALSMRAALRRLNEGWATRSDRVPLRIGIGLNQGMVTVGNLGHPRRMEFGVLGNAVNVASRLEGATKQLGLTLLAGASVVRLAQGRHRFAEVATLRVQGIEEPVAVSSPLEQRTEADASAAEQWLSAYAEALVLMRGGAWAQAQSAFEALNRGSDEKRALVQFQMLRIQQYQKSGGTPDSVYHLESK